MSELSGLQELSWAEVQSGLCSAPTRFPLGTLYAGAGRLYVLLPHAIDRELLESLAQIRNANVAPMVAFAVEAAPASTCVVYAWECDMLGARVGDGSLSWASRLKVALGLARAVHYLGDNLHGELESSTIGVDADCNPMLFGVGIQLLLPAPRPEDESGYRSPEHAGGDFEFDQAAVVFNFGVLMLELLTGAPAHQPDSLPLYLSARKIYTEDFDGSLAAAAFLIDSKIADDSLAPVTERFLALALACTADDPLARPGMDEVWRYLDELHVEHRERSKTVEAARVQCSNCLDDFSSGIYCERRHYICTACLNALVLAWSERKHIITKNKGCIFCPKRFEFGGSYMESSKPLCDASPWLVEDLRGVVSEQAYGTYMERVFKTRDDDDVMVFRMDSSAKLRIPRTNSTNPDRSSPVESVNLSTMVKAVDDFGTIMTTMSLDDVLEEAEDKRGLEEKFLRKFEEEKRRLEVEARVIESIKTKVSEREAGSSLSSRRSAAGSTRSKSVRAPHLLITAHQILMKLFVSTDGVRWRRHTNWGKTKSFWGRPVGVGDWFKVKTSVDGAVLELNLKSNRLNGMIPYEIGNLFELRVLNLSNNKLRGVIPAQLASLQSLSSLNLDGNTLAGSIPPEISTMTGLVTLDLSCNKLIAGVSALTNLRVLALNNNLLAGQVPSGFSALTQLSLLALHCNRFTGPLADVLKTNPKLKLTY